MMDLNSLLTVKWVFTVASLFCIEQECANFKPKKHFSKKDNSESGIAKNEERNLRAEMLKISTLKIKKQFFRAV